MLAATLVAMLAACGGQTFDASSLLVSPGKYDIYTCPQIGTQMIGVEADLKRLEGLMAQASKGAGGTIVNGLGYESDYLSMRGEMNELKKSAAAKDCKDLPSLTPRVSDGRASDNAIH